jgi:hypothetical protein
MIYSLHFTVNVWHCRSSDLHLFDIIFSKTSTMLKLTFTPRSIYYGKINFIPINRLWAAIGYSAARVLATGAHLPSQAQLALAEPISFCFHIGLQCILTIFSFHMHDVSNLYDIYRESTCKMLQGFLGVCYKWCFLDF